MNNDSEYLNEETPNSNNTNELSADYKKIRQKALNWLASREYSQADLRNKLLNAGLDETKASNLLIEFTQHKWVDDERYIEVFVRSKINSGWGTIRIIQEIKQHGIHQSHIEEYLNQQNIDWFEQAKTTYNRRYTDSAGLSLKDKAKRYRFLQYRGFTSEQIQYAMRQD